jgi:transposase-like protein
MTTQRKSRAKRRTPAVWRGLFAEHAQSGLSVKAFCAQRGIGYSTFSNWKRRLVSTGLGDDDAAGFVELSPLQALPDKQWDIELTLGDDIVLRVSRR